MQLRVRGASGHTLQSVPRSVADHPRPSTCAAPCPTAGWATPTPSSSGYHPLNGFTDAKRRLDGGRQLRTQLSYLATPSRGGEGGATTVNSLNSDEPMESVSRANQRCSARRRELYFRWSVSHQHRSVLSLIAIRPCFRV